MTPTTTREHEVRCLGVALPEGWTVTFFADGRHAHITWPSNGCVSIDTVARVIRGGMTTIGKPDVDRKYTGRGWKAAIVADAAGWLRSVFDPNPTTKGRR